jgi:hypothetical protein
MAIEKYNKYSAFFDVLNDAKASFSLEKEQLYDTIQEVHNNTLAGKTNFSGQILEAPTDNSTGGTTQVSNQKVYFAKVRLDDIEDYMCPDPNSVADPVLRKKLIAQHKTAIFAPSDGKTKAVLAPGDKVECNFSISGPNRNGKQRGFEFSDNVISKADGNFQYSDGSTPSQAAFSSGSPKPLEPAKDAAASSELGENLAKYYTIADRKEGDVKHVLLHSTDGFSGKNAAQRTISRFARGPTISYTDPNTGKKNPPCSEYPNGIPHGTICHPTRKNVEKPVKTSIHWALDNSGAIVQGVLEKDKAHHGGSSKNKTSIGIEMCGKPNEGLSLGYQGKFSEMYNETLLINTAKLVADICKRWKIPADRNTIIGHYEIAPSRRSDPGKQPGSWDWDIFIGLVKGYM